MITWATRIGGQAALAAATTAFTATLACLVLSGYQQVRTGMGLEHDRLAMADLANAVRAMRAKAMAQRQPHELLIDVDRGVIYISAIPGRQQTYTALERTMWLPEGLEVSEAPRGLTAQSNGTLTPTSVVVTAASYRRLFRLTTTAGGMVELHEEPTS